jgi:hypothetical protein
VAGQPPPEGRGPAGSWNGHRIDEWHLSESRDGPGDRRPALRRLGPGAARSGPQGCPRGGRSALRLLAPTRQSSPSMGSWLDGLRTAPDGAGSGMTRHP